jgi:thiosulfate/3-mercaptopyruvate sulfurtransferase
MAKLLIKHPTVSVEWLSSHLESENLVVLDGSIKEVDNPSSNVSEVQIPNARFFDLKTAFSDVAAPFPTTFPSEAQFTEEAQKLGIFKDSAIVVYDDKGIYSSARVWWLFKAMGHDNVAVLNGGLPEWIKSGHKTELRAEKSSTKGDFVATYKPGTMAFFDDVREASEKKSHVIIDARSEARFKELEPEPRAGLRMGNIPNSVNMPYKELLEAHELILEERIKTKFQELANKEDKLIFSCGSGITACVLALGATMSGYENISVYDGSWTEWGTLVTNK